MATYKTWHSQSDYGFSSYSIKYKYFNVLCFYCRCASDLTGLKDQSTTNNIVHKFILHYNDLFADENEPGVSARNTEVSIFFAFLSTKLF